MTALIPEQRGQGFYSEIIITKMRFNFDTLGASEVMGILPLSTSWLGNAAVKHTVDSLYTHDEKTFTIDQGEYRQTTATKTDWDAWIAASSKKSLSYTLPDFFSNNRDNIKPKRLPRVIPKTAKYPNPFETGFFNIVGSRINCHGSDLRDSLIFILLTLFSS